MVRLLPASVVIWLWGSLWLPIARADWPDETRWAPLPGLEVDSSEVQPAFDYAGDAFRNGAGAEVDIVGDAVPAGYWHEDETSLSFRIRLAASPFDSDGALLPATWAIHITSSPFGEQALVLSGGDGALRWRATSASSLDTIALEWPDPIATAQVRGVAAGTTEGGGEDIFLDLQVPWEDLEQAAFRGGGVYLAMRTGLDEVAPTDDLACRNDSNSAGVVTSYDSALTLGLAVDGDDDGLADFEEIAAGTSRSLCDSDHDSLPDGLEMGVSAIGAGTDPTRCYRADADPTTTTDPLAEDTDRGGIDDGGEDRDRNGEVGPWETDPLLPEDDADIDGDGIADVLVDRCALPGSDEDHDGDGLLDADEGLADPDADGLPAFCDEDDDGDGIPTVTEGTGDSDGDGTPDHLDTDSDNNGVPDGTEGADDTDCDGIPDFQDPDDVDGGCSDPDGDGLDNDAELECGSDPNAADSDGDGIADGSERCDADSDCDLLPDRVDGVEDTGYCEAVSDPPDDDDGCTRGDRFLDCGTFGGGACQSGPSSPGFLIVVAGLAAGFLRLARSGRSAAAQATAALFVVTHPAHAGTVVLDGTRLPTALNSPFFQVPTATPDHLGVTTALTVGYTQDPFVYRYDEGQEALIGPLASAQLTAGWAARFLAVGASLPVFWSGSDVRRVGTAPGDLRLHALGPALDVGPVRLSAAAMVALPTGSTRIWVGAGGVSGAGALVTTYDPREKGLPVVGTLSLGALTRPRVDTSEFAWGPELTWALGAAWFRGDFRVFGELDGSIPLVTPAGPPPGEWRLGAGWNFTSGLGARVAAGTGTSAGVGSPAFRALCSLSWNLLPP